MPNWCSSSYVIGGDKKEVKKLYGIMHGLEKRKTPAVKNGFGTAWLGCLVNALGADWNKVYCRGDWSNLEMEQDTLKFSTETAWGPCNEVFDLIRQKFPSLSYYFLSEEPGMGVFQTNDRDGKYFTDKFRADICTPEEEYQCEYFEDKPSMFKWLEEIFGQPVTSDEDIEKLTDEWENANENAFCNIDEFIVIE